MKQGWQITTIGEICDVGGGSTPRRTDKTLWDKGTYPWFTVDDIREQGRIISFTRQKITEKAWKTMRVFPANSVLLCCTASIGEYALTTIPITSNQQFNGLTIKEGIDVLPMFLLYYCSTLKDKLLSLSGRTTINFVSGEKVRNLSFAYPPLSEQQRIVAMLDAEFAKIDALKANAEKNLQNAKDLFQAALKKELEPKEGWKTKPLSQVVDLGTHISYGIVQPEEDIPNGVPIVRPMDLTTEILTSTTNLKRTKQSISEAYQRSILKGTEILMCVRGTTGIVSLSSIELKGCNTTRGIVPLCISDDKTRKFVYYVLRSESCQKYISEYTNGTALKQINIADVKNIPIVVAPYDEQATIIYRLDVLNKKCKTLQANYEKTLSLCDDLKQALLRKAFNGEL